MFYEYKLNIKRIVLGPGKLRIYSKIIDDELTSYKNISIPWAENEL